MAPSGKNFMALQHLRRGFTSTAGLLASIGAVGVPFLAPLYCFRAALTPALSRSVSGTSSGGNQPSTAISRSLAARQLPGRRVMFQPDFALGSQFAGVAVALAEGVFAARGLEVQVLSPCPERPGDEVAAVEKLQSDLGSGGLAVGSTEQNGIPAVRAQSPAGSSSAVLVAAQGHGHKVKAVSAMFQRTPLALGALPGTQISSLKDLQGQTVGMARDELPLFKGMAAVAGLHNVKVVEVTHEAKMQRLLNGDVDAIQIYETTEVLELQSRLGVKPNVLPIGSEPYDRGYAQVLFATPAALHDESLRLTLRSFLSATYEGWRRAAADPRAAAEAVAVMTGERATRKALDFHREVLLRVLPFLEEPQTGLPSAFQLGTIHPSRWLRAVDTYSKAGLVPPRLAAAVSHTADLSLWPGAPMHPVPGGNGSCLALDGLAVAGQIRAEAKASAEVMLESYGRRPGLAVIRFGDLSAAEAFRRREVPSKQATSWYCMDRTGAALGIDVTIRRLPTEVTQAEALAAVAELNKQPHVDAVMVEIPVPTGLNCDELFSKVDPQKRVDAIDKHSLGALIAPDPNLRHTVPVSPTSVLELLSRSGVGVSGRKVTMVGYGRLVGAPLVQMLLRRGAAVSICSANCGPDSLRELCLSADVIVSAAGVPGLITRDHVRPGAVVINVGTVFDPDGCVLLPDVASDVASVASVMAGCPGGVGPIPVAVLMRAVAANAHRRTGASSTLCLAGADVLCESRVAAELPPGWETCIRHRGSAYVCPEIGAPAAGPVRDTTAVAKTFAVTGFGAAVTFINKVAELAQSFGHHPDVQLTDFRHVRLELSSVSAGGVTVRDLEMARLLDDLAAEFTEAA